MGQPHLNREVRGEGGAPSCVACVDVYVAAVAKLRWDYRACCVTLADEVEPLEVHPPDHAIHSWRDFIIHIATIVVGLLIAIGLEQSVEALHHRHLLHQAREQLRREMAGNRKTLKRDLHLLEVAGRDSRYNIDLLSTHSRETPGALRFGWSWNGMQSSAWTTARETGALALMPYDEVQMFALVYGQQDVVNAEATQHIHHYAESLAPIERHGELQTVAVAALSPAEREQLVNSFAESMTEVEELRDLLTSLDRLYDASQEHR